jgi:hypothetical protein
MKFMNFRKFSLVNHNLQYILCFVILLVHLVNEHTVFETAVEGKAGGSAVQCGKCSAVQCGLCSAVQCG